MCSADTDKQAFLKWHRHQAARTCQVVAVLPPGGDAAKEARYVNCVENKLGLPDFLKGKADVVVTADKEGEDSGVAGLGSV